MGVDVKYGRVTTERGSIPDDEPVVLFRAQDELLLSVLRHYRVECVLIGASREHVDAVTEARERVRAWQAEHDTKVPDPIGGTPQEAEEFRLPGDQAPEEPL
jgi:hypothetical protein